MISIFVWDRCSRGVCNLLCSRSISSRRRSSCTYVFHPSFSCCYTRAKATLAVSGFGCIRTNFDPDASTFFSSPLRSPVWLCPCVAIPSPALEHCDLSHGNRYSARGYRTIISSSASHSHIVAGFSDAETVHRTVSFGYGPSM